MSIGAAYAAIVAERDALREALRPFAIMARMIDTLPQGTYMHREMLDILAVHRVTPEALTRAKALVPSQPIWVMGWRDTVTGDVGQTSVSADTADEAAGRYLSTFPNRVITNVYQSVISY